jgi:sugar O-acyltransferase (sialic acid O-acetyltransferase NeuD family)
MTDDLVIVGAGRSAGAIVWMVNELNHASPRWRLRGFLDDDLARKGTEVFGFPVLGPTAAAAELGDARFVIGVAHYRRPFARAEIVARLNLPRERFATLVHPSASVAPQAHVGVGVLAFHYVLISDGASVGDHAYLSAYCLVAHDAVVGDGATMAARSSLLGGSRLGPSAYAGGHCVIRDGITVGEGAVVGLGGVVVWDVAPRATVIGNPARPIPGSGK